MTVTSELKSNALVSATYDTVLQICLRVISFILNAFIIRHVSSSVFAVMTVRLNLLYATGLFLSREAFRRAALGCKSPKDIKKVINLIWIGAVASIPLMGVGWILWCYVMETPPPDVTTHYYSGVFLVLLSVIVEITAESPYIMAELHLWAKVKVAIEGAMQLTRSLLLAVGIFVWPNHAVLIFGLSHLTGSILYCASYYALFAREFRSKKATKKLLLARFRNLFVTFSKGKMLPEVDVEMWSVCVSFFKQGWLKEALTEGEFYLMNFLPLISLQQQGVYQVVSNLGSLAARLVFRSIEGASYKFFAQSLQRGKLMKDQDKARVSEVGGFIRSLLRNMLLVSLFIVTFGWAYSHPLLQMYGGPNLSASGFGLLRAQCLYVVFLALNGVTEAFTFAAMSDKELEKHNKSLVVFSAVYVLVTVVAVNIFGVYGFVVGNCTNMLLRIIQSLTFINRTFSGSGIEPLEAFGASVRVFSSFAAAFVVTAASEIFLYQRSFLSHILVGMATAVLVAISLRKEIEEIVSSVFGVVDKIYCKVFKVEGTAGKKFNFYFLNLIYGLLYS